MTATGVIREQTEVLVELRQVLEANQPIPDEISPRAHHVENESRHLARVLDEKVVDHAHQVEAVFTGAPLDVLRGFEPCTIPPKTLTDPVRVGQASDNVPLIRLLGELRELPAWRCTQWTTSRSRSRRRD